MKNLSLTCWLQVNNHLTFHLTGKKIFNMPEGGEDGGREKRGEREGVMMSAAGTPRKEM